MKIKEELNKLNDVDIWSLMLFVLYKMTDIPEYSSISQLSYILDKDNLIKLCEYFGGLTIKIPTTRELETIVRTLLLYKYVNIDKIEYNVALSMMDMNVKDSNAIRSCYVKVCEAMDNYHINSED